MQEQQISDVYCVYQEIKNDGNYPDNCHPLTANAVLKDQIEHRYELMYIDHSCGLLSESNLLQVIAKCRDLLAKKVLVECPTDFPLQESDLLSLGFYRCAMTDSETGATVFYIFDIKHYKPTPDWLNPKFWANPQMWDKFRW